MDLQTSVFLLFILFTAGHSLRCYECNDPLASCADQTIQTCPVESSQCLSTTAVTQVGDVQSKVSAKSCAPGCLNVSMNLYFLKTTISCCNKDLCNAKDIPDPSTNVPNGKKCFSCDVNSCSNVMSCSGTEDRCVKATGINGGQSMVVKGCASKSICDSAALFGIDGVSCCEGNMCNGAPSVSQSFLFLCCSLLSYFLLH